MKKILNFTIFLRIIIDKIIEVMVYQNIFAGLAFTNYGYCILTENGTEIMISRKGLMI